MRSAFILSLFVFAFFVQATAQDNLATYKRAKTLIGYGNYVDAMELLRPYMDEAQFGELSLYASYHFAYAAYHNKQFQLAQDVLKSVTESKSWRKKDDSRYLLALAYFEESENLEALNEIEAIKDTTIFAEAERASYKYLHNTSVSFLVGNVSKFKRNNGYMLVLKEQLEKQTIMSTSEKAIYNEIKEIKVESGQVKPDAKKDNGILDIAVILPFNYAGGSGVQNLNSGNFVFELYQGLNFAFEEIKNQGMAVSVRTFDSQRDSDRLKSILSDPFFQTVDIIIGPVYPEESEIVAAFSENRDIPFINPLSNLDDKFEGLEYAYLFRPSVRSIADGIIEFARKNGIGKKLAIAHSNTARDEELAKNLAGLAEKFGFEIVRNQKVADRDVRPFFDAINVRRNENPKADMIIILSDDPNIASPTFGLMEALNKEIPILVMDSWLFFNFANYEMLETQNFHFIGNNTIKFDDNLDSFREAFKEVYQSYPSLNAQLGYELANWIAQTINPDKGFEWRKNLDQAGYRAGKVTYGFDFRNSKNNRYVPVLKLENGILQVK